MWVSRELGADTVIAAAKLLDGGAVQENWRLDVAVNGEMATWVMRTDADQRLSLSLDREAEFAVIAAVAKTGVPVAKPILRCADASVIGRPFLIQTWSDGQAQARQITRDADLAEFGPGLARELGRTLAMIHAIRPPQPDLAMLPFAVMQPARTEANRLKTALTTASQARPALDYALAWLDTHAPATQQPTLVHGDYRTGNYMVRDHKLMAILDWELSHWGDPHEDIGWFCARCWRFGNDATDQEAGGIAPRRAFYDGYNEAAQVKIDEAAIPYWEIMAAAKWAVLAVLQGDRFLTGGENSIELALTGLMAPEMEFDCLEAIANFKPSRAR